MNRRTPAWRAGLLVASGFLPLLLMTLIPLDVHGKVSGPIHEKINASALVTPVSPDLTLTALKNQQLSGEVTMNADSQRQQCREKGAYFKDNGDEEPTS